MARKLYPKPAFDALKNQGWQFWYPLNDVPHNGYLFLDPAKQRRRLQFRGREETNAKDQWLYGIYYEQFNKLDDMVFWCQRENAMLVLSIEFIMSIFAKENAKIDENKRWHVNVYFDRDGKAEFYPVLGSSHDVTDFRSALVA